MRVGRVARFGPLCECVDQESERDRNKQRRRKDREHNANRHATTRNSRLSARVAAAR
jgi:hypothetical protein